MIFKDIFNAVKAPGKYGEFLKRKGWMVFLYGVLLITIYFLIVNVIPVARFQFAYGGFRQVAEKAIPEFRLEDGRLYLEKTWYLNESHGREDGSWRINGEGIYLNIDTSREWVEGDMDEIQDILRDDSYSTVLIADSSNMAVKSEGRVQFINFSDLEGLNFSKEDIYRFIPMLDLFVILVLIVWYVFDIVIFFLGALIISLIALIIRAALKSQVTFGRLFALCIYARTLPLIIKMILNTFHIPVPFFWMMSVILSLAYLALAMKGIIEEQELEAQMNRMENSWKAGEPVWKPAGEEKEDQEKDKKE